MPSLPRSQSNMEVTTSAGLKSYIPGRNLPDAPFKQYSSDGSIKREYLNHRSSAVNESVSDEIKFANY
jgi:hypothetical protein